MIERRLEEQLQQVAEHNGQIEKIILFGSRAVGDYTERSDIDLAFVAPSMGFEEWAVFSLELEEELDTLLLLDLVKLDDASDELKQAVLESGQIIYERGKGAFLQ